jgi:NADPH:quinone reductase-like Zn-dependent oxidoreductase
VRSLGANEVIDYTTTDVGNAVHEVDLVLDTVGGEAPKAHELSQSGHGRGRIVLHIAE